MQLRFWKRTKPVHQCPHLPGLEIRIRTSFGDILRADCETLRYAAIMGAHTEIEQADDGGSNWFSLFKTAPVAGGSYIDFQARALVGVYPYGRREPRNSLPNLPS